MPAYFMYLNAFFDDCFTFYAYEYSTTIVNQVMVRAIDCDLIGI